MIRPIYLKLKEDRLLRNSLFLMGSYIISAPLNFIFIKLSTIYFGTNTLGLALSIMSLGTWVSFLSVFGFDESLRRFSQSHEFEINKLFNSIFFLILVSSFLISAVVTTFIAFSLSEYRILLDEKGLIVIIVFFMIGLSIARLYDSISIGTMKNHFVLSRVTLYNIFRIMFPLLLITLGLLGLLFGIMISSLFSILIAELVFLPKIFEKRIRKFEFHQQYLKDVSNFSFGNYIANIISFAPGSILPIIISEILGASFSAYFYVVWVIAGLVYVIPSATGETFMVEGIDSTEISSKIIRSGMIILLLLVPTTLVLFFFGSYLLSFFGSGYLLHANQLLQLMMFASVPISINYIQKNLARISKRVNQIIITDFIASSITFIFSIYLLPTYGLISVGYSWLIAQVIAAIYSIIMIIKFFRSH